ncbi:MAG: class I SAM-dependent methyltransferase [Pseudomonadota bacterium]|nr:class I SAM-dependent methyltransferase [Pseudomonadota bacterium]
MNLIHRGRRTWRYMKTRLSLQARRSAEVPGVELNARSQQALLRTLRPYYADQPFSAQAATGLRYYFENDFFSYADGIFLYSLLRHLRPRRFVEIGSGYSSALALDVNDLFLHGRTQMTFIEPNAQRLLSLLRPEDRARTRLHEKLVQDVPLSVFAEVKRGDVLFVDSSHVVAFGSDVNWILFEILPRLPSGVYVHFHDIFYPFEYPDLWIKQGRGWNEVYMLRAFLQYNRDFEIMLFAHYLGQTQRDFLAAHMPVCLSNAGGSLWLRRI